MKVLDNGRVQFDDVYDLHYNLFLEVGLAINEQQYLYDQDTGLPIRYKDKFLKATVTPGEIVYAGRDDMVFNPSENFNLGSTLFGFFLDKFKEEHPEIEYLAHYIEDETKERIRQRVVTQFKDRVIYSQFYNCLYLAFLESIFDINGNFLADLSNFDVVRAIEFDKPC